MPALPRGLCPTCGRTVAVRKGGLLREHARRAGDTGRPCAGSGLPAAGRDVRDKDARIRELAEGLLTIAKIAMPDTYFATDSRCQAARAALAELDA